MQAGLFQCKGEGFGVWLRDSVHIAMRGGNLIDPETAGRSLLYAVKKRICNGSDGPAMGAVGLWDYYLATGDRSALEEGYETLLETMTEIENRYNEEKVLYVQNSLLLMMRSLNRKMQDIHLAVNVII